MKRVLSIILVAAVAAPLLLLNGCAACQDEGYDKMSEHYGSK